MQPFRVSFVDVGRKAELRNPRVLLYSIFYAFASASILVYSTWCINANIFMVLSSRSQSPLKINLQISSPSHILKDIFVLWLTTSSWSHIHLEFGGAVNVHSVMGFRPNQITCIAHIIVLHMFTCTAHICLLYKGIDVYSLMMKYNIIHSVFLTHEIGGIKGMIEPKNALADRHS